MREGYCVHWNGFMLTDRNAKCGGGVSFAALDGDKTPGMFKRLPCVARNPTNSFECPERRWPTAEEIAASDAAMEAEVTRVIKTLEVIGPWRRQHKGKNHAEVIECPACKGRLHLTIAALNGHVHGQCETPECVSWME